MKTASGKYKLCIIGTFPPPIHGLSLMNKAMKDKFVNAGIKPIVLDTSSKSLNHSFVNIISRSLKIFLIMLKFSFYIIINRIENIYIGLSGGLGQIYDLFFITVGTLFNSKIYIHHHSFAYLNKKSVLTSLIIKISKNSATHIVLCDAMKNKLSLYNEDIIIEVLSNAALLKTKDLNIKKNNSKFTTIGFLSNISFEKGIKEYFEVMEKLIIDGYKVKGVVAGQIVDLKSKKYLSTNLIKLRQICYIGKIEVLEKEKFFDKIDILLMPTKYKNEAEPLVIHEAMSHGVTVIAINRGCISNMVPKNTGIVINTNQQYISYTTDQIINWIKYPEKLILARKLSYEQFCNKKAENLSKIDKIFNNILT